MGMERHELLRFQTQDWFNDPSVEMVIVENEETVNVLDVPVFETELESMGMTPGLTGPETSEAYHQVLVGVEGWLVNLTTSEFTRIDRSEIIWLAKNKGYPRTFFTDFKQWVKERPGQAAGKNFGI